MAEQSEQRTGGGDAAALVAQALGAADGPAAPAPPAATPAPAAPPAGRDPAPRQGQETPAPGGQQAQADALAKLVNDAVAAATGPLKSELETLRGKETQRETQRRAEDARASFIRDELRGEMPSIYRQLLPATENRAELHKAATTISDEIRGHIDHLMRIGKIVGRNDGTAGWRSVSGAVPGGGVPPMQFGAGGGPRPAAPAASAQQLVASALGEQR